MGSVAAGLASVGGSLAAAQELRRKEQIEQIKLAIEQGRLGVEQEYADTNRQRFGLEKGREERLAAESKKPTISKWQLMGNTMIATGQNPDGSPFVKSIQLNPEVGYQLKALKDEIAQAPVEAQPMLEAMTNGYVAEGNIKGASDAIRPVLQAIAKDKALPGQETVREGYQAMTVDVPGYGPVVVQVPTRSVTRKVPRGESGSSLIPPMGPEDTSIPTPLASGATDRPNAPQSGPIATGGSLSTSNLPKIPLPPGSKMIGVKPPPGAKGQLKPEMEAGLRVLQGALYGDPLSTDPDMKKGLVDTVGVLDSWTSRKKLVIAGVGKSPNPSSWITTDLMSSGLYDTLSKAEQEYVFQLNRAIGDINSLRSITGLPRSTQALMDRYAMELPDPRTTSSSMAAKYKIGLIKRQLDFAKSTGALNVDSGVSNPNTGSPVDVNKILDDMLLKPGAPSGGTSPKP
jgi:hypothetical protein